MAAAKINLTIEKGAKYLKTFIWKDRDRNPISLASYAARMQIRQTISASTPEIELTTDNGRIDLEPGGETGRIDLLLGATETDALGINAGVFDLELYNPADSDDVYRLMEGVVTIKEGVTR